MRKLTDLFVCNWGISRHAIADQIMLSRWNKTTIKIEIFAGLYPPKLPSQSLAAVGNDLVPEGRSPGSLPRAPTQLERTPLIRRLSLLKDGSYEVFLKDLTGKPHTFVVRENTTMREFALAIRDRLGIPLDQFSLIYAGKLVYPGLSKNMKGESNL